MWKLILVAEMPSVRKQIFCYGNTAWYWLVMEEVAKKVTLDEDSDEEGMEQRIAFSCLFGMVKSGC